MFNNGKMSGLNWRSDSLLSLYPSSEFLISLLNKEKDLGPVSQNLPRIFLSFLRKSTFKNLKYARRISRRHAFDLRVAAQSLITNELGNFLRLKLS